MVLGGDTRYDQPWPDVEKIKRRLELRYRLKEEGMRKRYDPFLQIKNVRFTDPAIDRYADLRKRGRNPGAPLKPKIFYTMFGIIFLPVIIVTKLVIDERKPLLEAYESGDIPYKDRPNKTISGLPQ